MKENKMSPLVKVVIPLDEMQWHGYSTETVWADEIENNRCRLRNSPFYAKGISFEDIVFVNMVEGNLIYDSVSIASGHSTYRIFVEKNLLEKLFLKYWKSLEEEGCTYESADYGELELLAVDVPSNSNINNVYQLLELGEKEGIWDFEEGHLGHLQ